MAQEVPVPEGLKGKYISTDSVNYINLSWDHKSTTDSLTTGYNILVNFPPEDKLLILGKAGIVFTNNYNFTIKNNYSSKYRFAIIGVQNFPNVKRSLLSDTIEVITPSIVLPNIEIKELKSRGENIILKWEYDYSIADLKGFRVYVNGNIFADENKISSNTDQLYFSYKENGEFIFQLSAVTNSGLESRLSQQKMIAIE
ncbi:MAG: hypothetical protein OEW67_10910 [Cyclobacteriaceae bacterium]|nr:hypothetical protein [Cyclobacteriaceae bacterium]